MLVSRLVLATQVKGVRTLYPPEHIEQQFL